ncbi:MAG: hypothetical protein Q7S22_01045 [Candidatus Micrarchaeota archaeon]|nr:hypothetical protein [Candidatus Micrarchaeota archaeon]
MSLSLKTNYIKLRLRDLTRFGRDDELTRLGQALKASCLRRLGTCKGTFHAMVTGPTEFKVTITANGDHERRAFIFDVIKLRSPRRPLAYSALLVETRP